MTKRLPDLLKEVFPTASFDPTDDGLGIDSFPEWDSLGHFNLLMRVEETYGIRFSVDEMSELKNLPQIRTALATRGLAA